ncbi:hypothetical protein HNP40_001954 [Mycobacteroides chelonae]|nr:hypothetical protein [Mycobacteroides chelonae]
MSTIRITGMEGRPEELSQQDIRTSGDNGIVARAQHQNGVGAAQPHHQEHRDTTDEL